MYILATLLFRPNLPWSFLREGLHSTLLSFSNGKTAPRSRWGQELVTNHEASEVSPSASASWQSLLYLEAKANANPLPAKVILAAKSEADREGATSLSSSRSMIRIVNRVQRKAHPKISRTMDDLIPVYRWRRLIHQWDTVGEDNASQLIFGTHKGTTHGRLLLIHT